MTLIKGILNVSNEENDLEVGLTSHGANTEAVVRSLVNGVKSYKMFGSDFCMKKVAHIQRKGGLE